MKRDKKNLDVEVDLVSFISLLSVCICFLLLTAVWIQIGSLNVKQAVGGQSAAETKKVPAVWTQMQKDGSLVLKFQDFPNTALRSLGKQTVVNPGEEGKINYEELEAKLASLIKVVPDLNTGLILPLGDTEYENVIQLMDNLKKSGLTNLGVSPL
ncbi:MAG: biopolymer transporter ExbD [Bdellovibrionaceae bacterium]|nr:biopolymer transporter ExbD [Pseudobdellovibrionaceae bacterium]